MPWADDPEQLTLAGELARRRRRSVEELRAELDRDDRRPWADDLEGAELELDEGTTEPSPAPSRLTGEAQADDDGDPGDRGE
jgi:hypothetical protein